MYICISTHVSLCNLFHIFSIVLISKTLIYKTLMLLVILPLCLLSSIWTRESRRQMSSTEFQNVAFISECSSTFIAQLTALGAAGNCGVTIAQTTLTTTLTVTDSTVGCSDTCLGTLDLTAESAGCNALVSPFLETTCPSATQFNFEQDCISSWSNLKTVADSCPSVTLNGRLSISDNTTACSWSCLGFHDFTQMLKNDAACLPEIRTHIKTVVDANCPDIQTPDLYEFPSLNRTNISGYYTKSDPDSSCSQLDDKIESSSRDWVCRQGFDYTTSPLTINITSASIACSDICLGKTNYTEFYTDSNCVNELILPMLNATCPNLITAEMMAAGNNNNNTNVPTPTHQSEFIDTTTFDNACPNVVNKMVASNFPSQCQGTFYMRHGTQSKWLDVFNQNIACSSTCLGSVNFTAEFKTSCQPMLTSLFTNTCPGIISNHTNNNNNNNNDNNSNGVYQYPSDSFSAACPTVAAKMAVSNYPSQCSGTYSFVSDAQYTTFTVHDQSIACSSACIGGADFSSELQSISCPSMLRPMLTSQCPNILDQQTSFSIEMTPLVQSLVIACGTSLITDLTSLATNCAGSIVINPTTLEMSLPDTTFSSSKVEELCSSSCVGAFNVNKYRAKPTCMAMLKENLAFLNMICMKDSETKDRCFSNVGSIYSSLSSFFSSIDNSISTNSSLGNIGGRRQLSSAPTIDQFTIINELCTPGKCAFKVYNGIVESADTSVEINALKSVHRLLCLSDNAQCQNRMLNITSTPNFDAFEYIASHTEEYCTDDCLQFIFAELLSDVPVSRVLKDLCVQDSASSTRCIDKFFRQTELTANSTVLSTCSAIPVETPAPLPALNCSSSGPCNMYCPGELNCASSLGNVGECIQNQTGACTVSVNNLFTNSFTKSACSCTDQFAQMNEIAGCCNGLIMTANLLLRYSNEDGAMTRLAKAVRSNKYDSRPEPRWIYQLNQHSLSTDTQCFTSNALQGPSFWSCFPAEVDRETVAKKFVVKLYNLACSAMSSNDLATYEEELAKTLFPKHSRSVIFELCAEDGTEGDITSEDLSNRRSLRKLQNVDSSQFANLAVIVVNDGTSDGFTKAVADIQKEMTSGAVGGSVADVLVAAPRVNANEPLQAQAASISVDSSDPNDVFYLLTIVTDKGNSTDSFGSGGASGLLSLLVVLGLTVFNL